MILAETRQRASASALVSLALHAFVLFGIGFVLPDPRKMNDFLQPLEVVLVNSKSRAEPTNADALAQHNLDGGGNTPENRRASTPLPNISDDKQFVLEQSAKRVQQLEQEAKRLMTQTVSTFTVARQEKQKPQENVRETEEEEQRRLEIARLEAQIKKDFDAYQKLPRRKFIGARAKEYRFAQYVEDWRIKIERIGNLNYPAAARDKKIFGNLQLTVSIRADGSLESMEVSRSSGHPILDAAAQRIVKLAAPFAPLPPDIRKDTDILSITRTWFFTPSDTLQSE